MIRNLFILTLFMSCAYSYAQEISTSAISVGGGSFTNSSFTTAWTIGNVTSGTVVTEKAVVNQGFIQPSRFLMVTAIESSVPTNSIKTYPNPTSDLIHISGLQEINESALRSFKLFDSKGNLVSSWQVKSSFGIYELDISALPSGLYLLEIEGAQHSTTSKYKIFKASYR